MKIIAILESTINIGGGHNQALNAIIQMQRLCHERFDFEVFTLKPENVEYLNKLGIKSERFSVSVFAKILIRMANNQWWQPIQKHFKLISSFEKKLIKHKCDLVYFVNPSPNSEALQKLNYITTVWDLCHRDVPEFPEVHFSPLFRARERYYKNSLSAAIIIITDSSQLADSISSRYGIDRKRLLPMPFSPSPFLNVEQSAGVTVVLDKYALTSGYFFYPAQFWPHKNHIRILEALVYLRKNGLTLRVVFSGGDRNNRSHLESFINSNNLGNQVKFLGFIPSQDMRGLYEGCTAVVMPTYFGPTNIPPLEAWMIGKPLIYSSHLKEQVGDAAICVNPDDEKELANAMRACTDPIICINLVKLGKDKLQQIDKERQEAEAKLLKHIQQFAIRRKCWA
jgi:glycosyltransferase involved in cell wall biosynthesis